jgi:hypothetical protein
VRPGPGWSWPGATVFVLAVSLGVGWAGTLILLALPIGGTDPELSTQGSYVLATVGGLMGGAVTTYLGAWAVQRARDRAAAGPPRPSISDLQILDQPPPGPVDPTVAED